MEKRDAISGGNHAALWHGRFKEGPDADAVAFEISPKNLFIVNKWPFSAFNKLEDIFS